MIFKKKTVPTSNSEFLRSDYFIKSVSGKYIFSSVIAMLFLYASSLIDTVLVGLFIGENGLSAMSLVSPVYLIYYTVGATVGIGASISASRALGKENEKKYNEIFSASLEIMAVLSIVMTVIGYVFIDPICDFLAKGVDGSQRTMVKQYLMSYLPGGAFNLISYISMYFLKTDGRPKISANLYSISAIINVVLSALLISPLFNFGVAGAGAATSVSLAFASICGMIYLLNGKSTTKFSFTKIDRQDLKEFLASGVPNGLSNFLESMRILMINFIIVAIGCSAVLPCYTVIRNVSDIISAVIIGISSSLVPMMGIFFGERDNKSQRILLKYAKKVGLITTVPIVAVACVLSKYILMAFGITNPELISEGMIAIPLATVGLIIGYINTLNIGYLTVIKRETSATVLVVLRLLVVLAVFAIPLSSVFSTYGVWVSLSLSEIVTAVIYLIMKRIIIAKDKQLDGYLLNTAYDKDDDLSFSVKNGIEEAVHASEQLSEYCEQHDVDMKRTMKLSLAIEEILVFLINHCVGTESEKYIDIRVCKLNDEMMLRFRYTGKLFDPVSFYKENMDNEAMMEDLIGIKLIIKSASFVNFRQTLGANNLLLIF